MAFATFNYASPELQKSPLSDLINGLMSGYTEGTKARYLAPTLEESLKKAKLYNQYYGPNIESQMGLRGAQAGHLGSLTEGQNITNKFLPKTLQAQLEKAQFASQNPLLGMTGGAGQVGALLYLQQHPELTQGQQSEQTQQPDIANLNPNQSLIPSIMQQQQQQRGQGQLSQEHMPNPQELLLQSIMNSFKPKSNTKVTPLETAQNYLKSQVQEYGKDSNEAQIAKDYVDKVAHGAPKHVDKALEEHRERVDNMAQWKSLPVETKASMIAIGQGAGFSADQTVKWLASGKPMKDLLFQHGVKDESEVEPVYQLTKAAQSQLLQREFASKEADYLSDFIRKSTGEYARTVAGYSPKLIKDQLEGKNDEKQARVMAARGLAPELVNLRLVLANSKSTVHAQKALADKAMLDLKNFRSLVTPKVWNRTQEIMDSELQRMFKHAKTGFGQKISHKLTNENAKKNGNDPLGIR